MKTDTKNSTTVIRKWTLFFGAIGIIFLVLGSSTLNAQSLTTWGFENGALGGWTFTTVTDQSNFIIGGASAPSGRVNLRGDFDSPVTLAVGQTLTVSGTVTFSSGFFGGGDLRFGVFNNGGTGGTASGGASSTWNGGVTGWLGYIAVIATGGAGAPTNWGSGSGSTIGGFTTGRGSSWISTNGGSYGLGGPVPAANATPSTYNFTYVLRHTATTQMQITANFDDIGAGGSYQFNGTVTDNGGNTGSTLSTSTFTSFGFTLSNSSTMTGLTFTNIYAIVSPTLQTAATFRILAGAAGTIPTATTVTGNVGCTTLTNHGIINGDVWVTTLTNDGTINGVLTQPVDATYSGAITDLTSAIATATSPTGAATAAELSGQSLLPGRHYNATGFTINGTLTLTGTANDVFIFQTNATLITGASLPSVVTLVGVLPSNVFWQVGSSATIAGDFKGIIMAYASIDLNPSATLNGRALAQTGAITLHGSNSVLPVELVSFTATANRMNADLHWSTATEINNSGFEVQRRQTGDWAKVGFVAGAGTSNSPRNYSYTDNNLSAGSYTYRLKQINNDGSFAYGASVEVVISSAPQAFALLQNYPNPFNPSTVISYQLPVNSQVTLKVYNMLGQEVATLVNGPQEAGSYTVTFSAIGGNTSTLASGVYVYRLQAGSFISTKKLVLMK